MNCPICKSNTVEQDENTQLCSNCGFYTTDKFLLSNISEDYRNNPTTELDNYLLSQPKLIQDLLFRDNDKFWLPIIIDLKNKGMIYPYGESLEHWKWLFSPYVGIPLFERVNYPIPDSDSDFYEIKLGIEFSKQFDMFCDAVEFLKTN